jgi:hypothetical protein
LWTKLYVLFGLHTQIGEILAKDFRRTTGIGIFRREKDLRVNDKTQLGQPALLTKQEFGRIRRLFMRPSPLWAHLIDGR